MILRANLRNLAVGVAIQISICASPVIAQVINEDLTLQPFTSTMGARFGHVVALSGSSVIVGAYLDSISGEYSGTVYIFDVARDIYGFRLHPEDGAPYDYFGHSVAISGTTAVVGAHGDDDHGSRSGSAYIFDIDSGQKLHKLLPTDGAAGDDFGHSVAISGLKVLVGSQGDDGVNSNRGSAYLFDATTGQQTAKLLPNDVSSVVQFGHSLAISGNTAIVGTLGDPSSAYLFDTTTGQQIAKLTPSDGVDGSRFGYSVAICDTHALVGAYLDDDNGIESGSAYLFDLATGLEIAKLLPSDGSEGDGFGYSVAINGTTAVISAPGDDVFGDLSGSAYAFDITTRRQIAKLVPSEGTANEFFGSHIALCGNTSVVGGDFYPSSELMTGSAFTYTIPCATDLNTDGSLDFFDVSAFLTAYAANDPIADFNADGSFNFFDVSAFLVAYIAGCP